ncbi:Golgi SNAP receptor complex member 1, partial [Trichinella papuae]
LISPLFFVEMSNDNSFIARNWEELRRRARSLESDINTKLLNFSKLGSSLGGPPQLGVITDSEKRDSAYLSTSQNRFETLSLDIRTMLDKLNDINEQMSELIRGSAYVKNPAVCHTMERHRDILLDYNHEFKRTHANIKVLLEREVLFTSSVGDVGECKINLNNDGLNNRKNDFLLKEHDHIKSSDRLLEDQIGIALATKESLLNQKLGLKGVAKKLNTLTKRYPAVHSVMQKIHMRKRRLFWQTLNKLTALNIEVLQIRIGISAVLCLGYWLYFCLYQSWVILAAMI